MWRMSSFIRYTAVYFFLILAIFQGHGFAAGPCAEARELVNLGRPAEAVAAASGLPGKPEPACLEALADAYTGLGDFKKAAALLEEAAAGGAANASIFTGLARLYSWEGDYKASLGNYDAALALKPGDCILSVEKARMLAWAARNRESSAAYAAADKACPGGWAGAEAGAKESLRRGRLYSAERQYKKAVELNPANEEALFDLAQLYSNSGLYAAAEPFYRRLAEVAHYNKSASRARARNNAWRDNLRLESGFSLWDARGADRMTEVRRTELRAGPAVSAGEKLLLSAAGSYADYRFEAGAGLAERGAAAGLSYSPSLYWGAGASASALSVSGRSFGGPASVYAWRRIADPAALSFALRRERLLNNRGNVLSGCGASSARARADFSLAPGLSAGAELARGRVDGGNYYTLAGADAKRTVSAPPSLFWAGARWERSAYARPSEIYFAPAVYNAYSLEGAWRRYFSKGGVYYGAPHYYAELKAAGTFDNSRYFSLSPRAAFYAEREKYWTLKLEFSLTSSHYYRDNYWALALVKVF